MHFLPVSISSGSNDVRSQCTFLQDCAEHAFISPYHSIAGIGSMRDERLNRMWQNKKVRFLRPTPASGRSENDDDGIPWFNIFALHQNRDLGRGSKNCVHESMIPEWMDLVIWGHEHECQIEPTESLVGTYRITQPGSSVATSLTNGESVRKRVGILEIRMNQFRLSPIPLSQVRAFALKEISLADEDQLDPDDAKIDERVNDVLGHHVDQLVVEAREKSKELIEDAEESRQSHPSEYDGVPEQKYTIKNPHEVLVRLKVEHTGYTALNNQRFGAKFVGQIVSTPYQGCDDICLRCSLLSRQANAWSK